MYYGKFAEAKGGHWPLSGCSPRSYVAALLEFKSAADGQSGGKDGARGKIVHTLTDHDRADGRLQDLVEGTWFEL